MAQTRSLPYRTRAQNDELVRHALNSLAAGLTIKEVAWARGVLYETLKNLIERRRRERKYRTLVQMVYWELKK